jgi:hypothetical protein
MVLPVVLLAGCRVHYVGRDDVPDDANEEDDAANVHPAEAGAGGHAPVEGSVDGKVDVVGDATVDVSGDAPADVGADASVDVSGDASVDTPVDALVDNDPDVRVETTSEAANEANVDASDASTESDAGAPQLDADADLCTGVALPAPILEYKFDDCNDALPTLRDSSTVKANPADAIKKGDLHCAGGHSGVAVYFSGDNATALNGYLTVPNSLVPNFSNALTVSLWVSLWNTRYSNIIGQWYSSDKFLLIFDDTEFVFTVNVEGDGGPTTYQRSAPLQLYRWVHLVGVFDGGSSRLYEDGKLYDGLNHPSSGDFPPGTLAPTTRDLQMGGLDYTGDGQPGSFMKGLIDDVRIYDVALNENQVRALDCLP